MRRESKEIRDWEPGDGLKCSYRRMAPEGMPCGVPVKTAVAVQDGGPGRSVRTVKRPLCEQHAARAAGGKTPGEIRAQAERIAYQRLVHEHWVTYQEYVAEEIDKLTAQSREVS